MFLGHLKKKKKKEDTQSGSENLPATTKKKSTGSINFSPRGIFSLRSRLIPAQLLNIVANNLRFPSVSSSWGLRLRQGKEVQLFGAEPGGQKPPTASENTQEGRNRVFKRERESWRMSTCIRSYWCEYDDTWDDTGRPQIWFTSLDDIATICYTQTRALWSAFHWNSAQRSEYARVDFTHYVP